MASAPALDLTTLFEVIFKCHQMPKQRQICGFQGADDPGYIGLAATTWVPMGA